MKKTETKQAKMSVKVLAAKLAAADVALFEDESSGVEDEGGRKLVPTVEKWQPPLF